MSHDKDYSKSTTSTHSCISSKSYEVCTYADKNTGGIGIEVQKSFNTDGKVQPYVGMNVSQGPEDDTPNVDASFGVKATFKI